jgi:hypothetical protein
MSLVAARDPRQAVLDHLASRGVRREARRPEPAVVGAGGLRPPARAETQAGAAPWRADLGSVQFLKEREVLGRRLYAVGFQAEHNRFGRLQMTMLVRAERLGRTWVARGVGGGGGSTPAWTEPRVSLGGSWGRHGFCGGGKVHPAGADIARIRLRFENGVELDDDTEHGWVIFYTDRPVERPSATVELLDPDGAVVSSFAWPTRLGLDEALMGRLPGIERGAAGRVTAGSTRPA